MNHILTHIDFYRNIFLICKKDNSSKVHHYSCYIQSYKDDIWDKFNNIHLSKYKHSISVKYTNQQDMSLHKSMLNQFRNLNLNYMRLHILFALCLCIILVDTKLHKHYYINKRYLNNTCILHYLYISHSRMNKGGMIIPIKMILQDMMRNNYLNTLQYPTDKMISKSLNIQQFFQDRLLNKLN